MSPTMPKLKEMIQAGMHFGHKRQRSYPKAKRYIFCIRDGIYIINLEETVKQLETAIDYVNKLAKSGKTILFVGTKKQGQKIMEEAAKKCEMPYMTKRWLGGTLTNFETIRKRIKYLNELERKKETEEYKDLTKQEKLIIDEEAAKLHSIFDGIFKMEKMPDALFVLDAAEEDNAIKEAIIKEIPVIAICDTNSNPDIIDYPIVANDEAVKSIEMIVNLVADAILEGKKEKK